MKKNERVKKLLASKIFVGLCILSFSMMMVSSYYLLTFERTTTGTITGAELSYVVVEDIPLTFVMDTTASLEKVIPFTLDNTGVSVEVITSLVETYTYTDGSCTPVEDEIVVVVEELNSAQQFIQNLTDSTIFGLQDGLNHFNLKVNAKNNFICPISELQIDLGFTSNSQ